MYRPNQAIVHQHTHPLGENQRAGFVRVAFCMREACDKKLKNDTGAEVRGTLFGDETKLKKGSKCAICGKPAKAIVYVARSY